MDLAIDVNSHVATTEGSATPTSYRASFEAAAQVGLITGDLTRSLSPSVGLRNVLVHEYVQSDLAAVADAAPLALEGYTAYVRQAAEWLSRRQAGRA